MKDLEEPGQCRSATHGPQIDYREQGAIKNRSGGQDRRMTRFALREARILAHADHAHYGDRAAICYTASPDRDPAVFSVTI